jgi:hypothetical protein
VTDDAVSKLVRSAHRPAPAALDALIAAADGSHTNGCMIALMPTPADAKALAIDGGEAPEELHCTLFYLGGDAAAWSPEQRADLVQGLHESFDGTPPVPATVFGVAHWNGDGENPSWVWSVGDDDERNGQSLEGAHLSAVTALEDMHTDQPQLPDQHTPWVAHICAQYTDDQSMVPAMEQHLGPVTFDRVRVSFGDDNTDIPLDGSTDAQPDDAHPESSSVTAAGTALRRKPTPVELASTMDFTAHQAGWTSAVDAAVHDWAQVTTGWRNEIRQQMLTADTAPELSGLSVSTAHGASLLYRRMDDAAMAAGRAQQAEAERQGVKVPSWNLGPDAVTAAGLSGRRLLRNVASVTSDVLGSRMVNAARQRARALFGVYSGIRLASEVDQALQDLSDAFTREQLGASITAAQNAGRMAVLEAAPKADYFSSEILDHNTCRPCRDVDGKQFSTLGQAEEAYPTEGYRDCLGGDRCRGVVIAVWDQGITAAGERTDDMATVTQPLGGKPSKGTRKDKRLEENDPAMAADCAPCDVAASGTDPVHFGSSQTKDTGPWDGAASRFDDKQYQSATAACDPGDGTVKDRCFLPHHEPTGALNVNGLHAAAGRVSTLKGHSPEAVAKAKAHLRSHYHAIGEDVPPSLAAAGSTTAAAISCPDGWKPDPDGDGCVPMIWSKGDKPPTCPPGMTRDPDGDGCVATASATVQPLAAAPAVAPPAAPVIAPDAPTAPWSGVLAVEGVTTGDGREFAPDALTWRDLPIPLRWNIEDSHGGEPRTVAVNVGRIDTIDRVGNQLQATGVLDLSDPNGQMARDKIAGQFLRGVSIDADSIGDAQIEYVFPESDGDTEEDDFLQLLFGQPDKIIFHGGRISAATLCDIPAFAEAYIALTDDAGAVVAGGRMDPAEWAAAQPEPEAAVVVAHGRITAPPADWFQDPGLSLPTPITVSGDRIYGHAAQWGTCHIGQTGQCVKPPREDYHDHYLTGELDTAQGTTVSVGQITLGTGHASLSAGHQAAAEHYDHTGYAVADVVVGNDSHGIWVAGAIRTGADPALVAELRASGQVSGDWRRIGGKLRLVGLLAVNVPGFPVPKMRLLTAGGHQVALVAAGQPTMAPGLSPAEQARADRRRRMDELARRVEGE